MGSPGKSTRARLRPRATSNTVARRMASTRQRDTPGEMALRRLLHSRGFRYLVDRVVIPGLRRRADILFPSARVAVFVDGCFWHSCPLHGSLPKTNPTWWRKKLAANKLRDDDTNRVLEEAGWIALRFWEHEDPVRAADVVIRAIETRTDRV